MSIGEFFAQNVFDGSLLLAVPLAVIAGLVSFLSPCVLPLVPGFLGYASGLTQDGETSRRRVLLGTSLFIGGFSLVFVAYGAAFGIIGVWLTQWQGPITQILGVVVIVMGVVLLGGIRFLQRTSRPAWAPNVGLAGAPVLGITFGLGWTPCIGPTLSAVIALSLTGGSPVRGALLGFAYCVGIGLPFLLVAYGFGWATKAIGLVRRNIRTVNIVGGSVLILLGLAMTLGIWNQWMLSLQGLINSYVTVV